MDMNPKEYDAYVKKMRPSSPIWKDCFHAFWIGGLICVLGQLIQNGYTAAGLDKTGASTATSMTLVLLAILLTGFSLYDNLAKVAGAGTLVPITGLPTPSLHRPLNFAARGLSPEPASSSSPLPVRFWYLVQLPASCTDSFIGSYTGPEQNQTSVYPT